MKKFTFRFTKTVRARLAAALAATLLLSTLPLIPGLSAVSPAAPAPAQVINNYPTAITPGQLTATTAMAIDQMDWTKKAYHSFYDNATGLNPAVPTQAQAYTAATSKTYNGTATPDHAVLSKDTLRFLGYGVYSNLDLLYTDAYSSFETLDFTFKPKQIRFHTMSQTGFLFNGSFSGANNAYYTGYALIIDADAKVSNTAKGTATLKLVYMENQLFNTTGNNTFPAAGLTFKTQDVIVPNIAEGTTPDFHVQLVKTSTGLALYVDGNLVREIDPAAGATLPGFGFFTGYYSHSCKVLTVVEFSDLKIAVKIGPAPTSPQVKFIDKDTGSAIADAQTTPANATASYVGDEFWVDTSGVQTINANGTTYSYVGSDTSNLAHITYKAGGAAANTVILYYKDAALLPVKHASINGGTSWDATGTASNPVNVSQGDIIDYKIDVNVNKADPSTVAPLVFNAADLTASQNGYTSAVNGGTGGATALAYTGSSAGYPNGVQAAPTASPVCIQGIMRQGAYNSANYYEQYLWLQTKNALPAGNYKVTVTVAADARTWGQDAETGPLSPSTSVYAFMRGVAGGANGFPTATYNKAYGYSTFSDQLFPTDTTSPLPVKPLVTAAGRITFRNGHTGVNTNNGNNFATTNNPYSVPTETTTFNKALVISDAQPAIVGLCLGGQMTGNTFSSAEHYTSMIRVFKVEFTLLTPPPTPYDVRDLLPEGLSLADDLPNYMTIQSANGSYTGAGSTFSTTVDPGTGRQQLDWSFPDLPGGVTSIAVKARVNVNTGVFENSASVTNKSSPVAVPDQTNSTWHAAAVVKVTEKYQNILSPDTALQDDTYTWLSEGDGYGVAPALRAPIDSSGKTYRYCAYSTDGGATINYGVPPDGQPLPGAPEGSDAANYLWDHVYGNDSEVILYFVPDVQVTIKCVELSDPSHVLKTTLDYNVPGYTPYTMAPSQMNSIDQYNYVSRYKLDGSDVLTGAPAVPVFDANQMNADHVITLYFASDPKITFKFAEDGNEYHILKNPLSDIVPYGDNYDPALSAHQPLPAKVTDPQTGTEYEYTGYRLDGAAIVASTDPTALAALLTVNTNHTYTLLYAPLKVPPQKNAYVNGSVDAQNGADGSPIDVKLGDKITYKVTLGSSWAGPHRVDDPIFSSTGAATKPQPVNFVNGSFETPVTAANVQSNSVPGWANTAEALIEIHHVGTNVTFAPSAPNGVQYAELNANTAGTLYQTVTTVPGTKVYWEFYHGARGVNAAPSVNTDVMDFLLGPTTANLTAQVRASDSWVRGQTYVWGHYSGVYTVPAGQTTTVFAFKSISTTSGSAQTQGNFLDGIRLYTSSYVELTKSADAPGGLVGIGDTVTYTIKAQNTGESDAKNAQVFDTLPAGTELVPGSVAIDGVGSSNYTYDASTRALSVNVGAGATASTGGLIKGVGSFSSDCNNAYTVTFKVKVTGDAIASNKLYENQSRVTFADRPDTAATPTVYTTYSNISSLGFSLPGNTITDVVPLGVEVVEGSITNGGVYDKNTRTITWHLPGDAPADTIVSFDTTVSAQGEYDNTADITRGDGTTEQTNTTYHRYLVTRYTLHLRQVVLNYDGSVALPYVGYFMLANDGTPDKAYSVTADSNQYGIEVPFRSFDVTTTAGMIYSIQDILPQYYDYAGYTVTSSYVPGDHTDIPASVDQAQADFTDATELWVTVYIKPGSKPGKYDWGAATNDFGTIFPTSTGSRAVPRHSPLPAP